MYYSAGTFVLSLSTSSRLDAFCFFVFFVVVVLCVFSMPVRTPYWLLVAITPSKLPLVEAD